MPLTSGETNLHTLLRGMEPVLDPAEYLFVSLPHTTLPAGLHPRLLFREEEGISLIITRQEAEQHALSGIFPCRRITLTIHSALEAVGFLAAILPRLAALGMGVNPVSAFCHDHLFVPADRAADALTELKKIAAGR
jgi:hypothetical protein